MRAIVCSSRRFVRCTFCQRRADIECDYPDKHRKSGTCDRRLCADHAREIGKDVHYCHDHPEGPLAAPVQGAMGF
jgi:hypothetical protein